MVSSFSFFWPKCCQFCISCASHNATCLVYFTVLCLITLVNLVKATNYSHYIQLNCFFFFNFIAVFYIWAVQKVLPVWFIYSNTTGMFLLLLLLHSFDLYIEDISCWIHSLIGLQTFSLAGLGAGVTEAILVNPFEVVKVSLQANRAHLREVPSTWTVTKRIVSTQVWVSIRRMCPWIGAFWPLKSVKSTCQQITIP